MTGVPLPNVAYQILMPLTGAYPLSAGVGNFGVGGRVSHCGSPSAAVADATSTRQKAKMERRMA